jgi:subtilisin family serine protease
MSVRCSWLPALALAVGLAACAMPERPSAAYEADASSRQLLVMLHLAAPHFRPDVSYNGNYDARVGGDARRRVAEALAGKYGLKVIDGWPMPALGVDCYVMQAPEDVARSRLEDALSRDPRVESVESMQLYHVLSHNDPLYPLQPAAKDWHLADLHRLATGKHVRIAEIDTGVEADHPDLAGRVIAQQNFVDDRAEVAEAHGTSVAGIIAARADNAIGIAGIAPEADLLALRACWERSGAEPAVCSSFTLAKALQFALDRKAQVINLSLGGPRDRLLERLLDAAVDRGIVVVGAVDSRIGDGGFPASHEGVLAVAGDDVHDAPARALLAPGRDIPTTTIAHKWGFVTGSSFAAAHVSGLVALLHELDPGLQVADLRERLAAPIATVRTGRRAVVDACAAVERTAGTCACSCALARGSTPATSH